MGKWRKTSTTFIVKGTDVLNAETEQCFALCLSGVEATRRTSDSRRVVLKIADTIKFHGFVQPQVQPEDNLATLFCTTEFINFSCRSKDPCRAAYNKMERMKWKYEYTRTWKAGMSKKIIYRLKLWEIHVCHKTEGNKCQS